MAGRMESLMIRLRLIDEASGPAGKLARQLDGITDRASRGMAGIVTGGAGLFAMAASLQGILQPAIEMDRSLAQVRSLGVREDALNSLKKTALSTSIALGENASAIAASAYDIQSAIAGLAGDDLAKFTQVGAVLAKGTKSDASTITAYMGTMYGIFQNTADEMGKAKWVQILAGQTATAVQMFKTTGAEMSGAFGSLGASAQSAGIGMAEQMAILGQLQATMSGSEAGSKYKAFLSGVGGAQEALGLKFTDSQNRLLPMVQILEQLKGKFGDTLDVAESDALKKAFGSDEAVGMIKLLMQNVNGLGSNIEALGKVTGMEQAAAMAKTMADPWQRLSAVGAALSTSLGGAMNRALIPFANWLIDIGTTLSGWMEKFPNITRMIGVATLVVMGLVAAFSAFAVVGGMFQLFMVGIAPVIAVARTATLLFNAALWANPITWIVAAIIALIVAIGLLIYYWDDVKKAALDFIGSVMDRFTQFKAWLSKLSPFAILGDGIDWLIEKINMIPGINIGGSAAMPATPNGAAAGMLDPEARGSMLDRASIVPPGGLQQDITNNTRSGNYVEKIEIHTNQPANGMMIADELSMM